MILASSFRMPWKLWTVSALAMAPPAFIHRRAQKVHPVQLFTTGQFARRTNMARNALCVTKVTKLISLLINKMGDKSGERVADARAE